MAVTMVIGEQVRLNFFYRTRTF